MNSFVDASELELTPNEINVIEIYTGGESLWINNFLRERNLEQLNNNQKDLMIVGSKTMPHEDWFECFLYKVFNIEFSVFKNFTALSNSIPKLTKIMQKKPQVANFYCCSLSKLFILLLLNKNLLA